MVDTNPLTCLTACQTGTKEQGLEAYLNELLIGRVLHILDLITGRRNGLKLLTEAVGKSSMGQHDAGMQTVSISQIRGTEGRGHDFDRVFHPLNEETRHRWLSIYRAHMDGVSLPAVELIRVGQEYYVRDGHHRISVARMLGQQFIDARVVLAGE